MAKLGIVLTGASYGKKIGNNQFDRDWNLSKENLKSNLIDCFKETDDVSVYVTTYENENLDDLFRFYQAKKSLILPYEGSHQRTTYIASLKNLINEDLDFIISTRFDISFNKKVSDYNIDRNKMNFLFKDTEPHWTNTRFVGDCLHAFPKKYLESFIRAIELEHMFNGWFMHGVYNHMVNLIGEDNIHFIFDGNHNSHQNIFYELIRANITE